MFQGLHDKIKRKIEQMLVKGMIRDSRSQWCSPLVVVAKQDGSLRLYVDFRKVNAMAQFDAFPMSWVKEMLKKIGMAKYISKLDLARGY